jgi:hypothetical protein
MHLVTRRFSFWYGIAAIAAGALALRMWIVFGARPTRTHGIPGGASYVLAGDAAYYQWQGRAIGDGLGYIDPLRWQAVPRDRTEAAHGRCSPASWKPRRSGSRASCAQCGRHPLGVLGRAGRDVRPQARWRLHRGLIAPRSALCRCGSTTAWSLSGTSRPAIGALAALLAYHLRRPSYPGRCAPV